MIPLIDTAMEFDKIQHSFLTKTFSKLGIEAVRLSTVKSTNRKKNPTVNIILNRKKFESFSSSSCIVIEVGNRNYGRKREKKNPLTLKRKKLKFPCL